MANIITRDWTGTNGDPWTDVDFELVTTAGTHALVQANQGWGPAATGTERIYVVTGYPQQTNHKVEVDAVWQNPSGAGRKMGLVLRMTADGLYGYALEVDSNVGSARVKIRRCVNGSWSDVLAWDDISGTVGSARLLAGETITARIENTDEDTVNLKLYIGSDLVADEDDTHTNRIESGGRPGVLVGSNCTSDDIIFDALYVRDFEDEFSGDAADLDEGVALVVDGTSYSWDELEAAGVTVGIPRESYDSQGYVCTLSDSLKMGVENAILYAGAVVTVSLDGDVVAFGRLRTSSGGINPAEGHTFELAGPDVLAADVEIRDPDTGAGTVRFNMPTDADDYRSDRANLEIGELIAWITDNHLEGDGGLRDQLAAPPDIDAYTQSELDAMDLVMPELTVTGDVLTAIEQLLAWTKYKRRIHPATREWYFDERGAGTIRQVNLATQHVTGEYRVDLGRAYTRVRIRGTNFETDLETLTDDGGGLTKGWNASLEATHSAAKSFKAVDSGLVSAKGTSGGFLTMDPDLVGPPAFSMVAGEWVECGITFTDGAEAGNRYVPSANTSNRFTFEETAWLNGGPSAGDGFTVKGSRSEGGKDNGYATIGRLYTLTDTDKGILPGACVFAEVTVGNQIIKTGVQIRTPEDETEPAEIQLDMPTLGLLDPASSSIPDPCTEGEGEYITASPVSIKLPTYDRTNPVYPEYLYPASGYYGYAYTNDSAKWSGVGKNGYGDPGVMRTLPLEVSGYTGGTAQDAQMLKLAQQLLAFLSPVPYEVRIVIAGIDTTWAGLDRRLQVIHTGGSTGPLADITTLDVLAVEWDPSENTTTVYAGTQASWNYDIQKMRDGFLQNSQLAAQKAITQKMRDALNCMAEAPKGSGITDPLPPQQICGSQVAVPGSGGGVTTLEDAALENIICVPNVSPEEKCSTYPCVSDFPHGRLLANVDAMDGVAVVGQQSKDFDGDNDRCGTPHGATSVTTVEAVTWCMEQIKVMAYALVAITGAHDQELGAASADLGFIRIALDGLVACMNANWAAIDACFKTRQVVTEHETGCELTDCEHDFTETVCEDPCLTDPAVVDVSTPPSCPPATC